MEIASKKSCAVMTVEGKICLDKFIEDIKQKLPYDLLYLIWQEVMEIWRLDGKNEWMEKIHRLNWEFTLSGKWGLSYNYLPIYDEEGDTVDPVEVAYLSRDENAKLDGEGGLIPTDFNFNFKCSMYNHRDLADGYSGNYWDWAYDNTYTRKPFAQLVRELQHIPRFMISNGKTRQALFIPIPKNY